VKSAFKIDHPVLSGRCALGERFEYRRSSQPRPKLGPFLETLEAWLEAEAKLPPREQRTAQRIYEALRLEGYTGAVDTVRRQMRALERRRHSVAGGFIPQYFAPGEAYQFDFSHEHVELGGIDQVVKLAHVSRAFFLIAYPRESQEMVFDAHAGLWVGEGPGPEPSRQRAGVALHPEDTLRGFSRAQCASCCPLHAASA
jgi:hypothetical protein